MFIRLEGSDHGKAADDGGELVEVGDVVLPLLREHLEEGDVDEGAARQTLQHDHHRVLEVRVHVDLLKRVEFNAKARTKLHKNKFF